jgi:hypothetical protein
MKSWNAWAIPLNSTTYDHAVSGWGVARLVVAGVIVQGSVSVGVSDGFAAVTNGDDKERR